MYIFYVSDNEQKARNKPSRKRAKLPW